MADRAREAVRRQDALEKPLLLFFLFAAAGWVWEVVFVAISAGRLVNRGFLHGPWLPVYGVGGLLFLLLAGRLRARSGTLFLLCALLRWSTAPPCGWRPSSTPDGGTTPAGPGIWRAGSVWPAPPPSAWRAGGWSGGQVPPSAGLWTGCRPGTGGGCAGVCALSLLRTRRCPRSCPTGDRGCPSRRSAPGGLRPSAPGSSGIELRFELIFLLLSQKRKQNPKISRNFWDPGIKTLQLWEKYVKLKDVYLIWSAKEIKRSFSHE